MEQNRRERCCWRFTPIRNRIREKTWNASCVPDSIRLRRCERTRVCECFHFETIPPPDSYDVAILAFFVRVSDRKGNVDVPAEQAALAEQIYKMGKPGNHFGVRKSVFD